jgi:signal transduction histidine kinase
MASEPDKVFEVLRSNSELKSVDNKELEWLVATAEIKNFEAGDKLFKKGDPIDRLFIVIAGEVDLTLYQAQGSRIISSLIPASISGALPFSRATEAQAEAVFTEDSQVLILPKKFFPDMICNQPQLTEALVHTMTSRVRTFTHEQQQTEKLASLGKLSAGLHHELNNPVAAIRSSTKNLNKIFSQVQEATAELLAGKLENEQIKAIQALTTSATEVKGLSLLERSDKEEELSDWLESIGIEDSFEIAEVFVCSGIDKEKINTLSINNPQQLRSIIHYLSGWLHLNSIAQDIYEGSGRISQLVGAVKEYTHMDRSASRERYQILDGIKSTVQLLNHKRKQKKLSINIEERKVPEACVFVGELNQVWMNLLDNAIDASPEGANITVDVQQVNGAIEVAVKDEGEGIAESELEKIFNPFYTTKKQGEGSGMGLDLSKKIIESHQGSISVKSEPGSTEFKVIIPIEEE